MKNYDPCIRWGSHKVKVTFQSFAKKAHVICSIGGNCKGGDILKSIIDSLAEGDESAIVDNKAGLSFNNDDWFFIKELNLDDELCYLEKLIVGAEIIDYVEEVRG